MEQNLNYTSFVIPKRRSNLLTRARLIEQLHNQLENKLILVAAPAGYGKTSLLIDFAYQSGFPFCWYTVDRHAHTLHQFLTCFVTAISRRFPSFGAISKALIFESFELQHDIERLATVCANEIYETIPEPFGMVLDDFQVVSGNPAITAFVGHFVQKAPDSCHILILSRNQPAIPDLDLLLARSQAGLVGLTDLAFTGEEIRALALCQSRQPISIETAELLASETEGWITGILFCTRGNWQEFGKPLKTFTPQGIEIYDYLAGQLLDQQSPELREFLLRSSLLGEINPEILQTVLGTTVYTQDVDWAGFLETLRRENLFIFPVDNGITWFRYHSMFRDFLQAKLAQERPEEKMLILNKLASVFRNNCNWERAYDVYQDLKDKDAIIDLIEEAGSTLLKGGRYLTLLEWLDELPAGAILGRPALLSIKGCVLILTGRIQEGIPLLDEAEAAFRKTADLPRLARTLNRRATAYHFLGDYGASLQDAQEALTLVGDRQDMNELRAEALRYQGLNLLWLDCPEEAIKTLKAAHFTYRLLFDDTNTANLLQDLGLANRIVGDLASARNSYEQALEHWRKTGQVHQIAHLLNNLAMVFQLGSNFERACETYNNALAFARRSGNIRAEAFILTGIGDLYALLDAPAAAERAYQLARAIAESIQHRYLQLHLTLAESTLALGRSDLFLARSLQAAAGVYLGDNASAYEYGLYSLECGKLALQESNYPEAILLFGQAFQSLAQAQRKEETRQAHFLLAVVLCAQGEAERAEFEFRKLAPHANVFHNYNLVNSLRTSGKNCLQKIRGCTRAGTFGNQFLLAIDRFEQRLPSIRRSIRAQNPAIPFDPPKIVIRCFGDAVVELDGKVLNHADWQVQGARDLFLYLVNSPTGMSKGSIGLEFWPDKSPEQLKPQFKSTIHRLRAALGQEDIVLYHNDRYEFNRAADYECDMETFLEKLHQGRTADSPERQADYFREAVALYRGHYLTDVNGSWVVPERERLWQLYANAIQALAQYHLERGEFLVCQDYCLRALQKDPCFEEAHRLLMRSFAAQGHQSAVVHQFQLCTQSFHETYSMAPSRMTRELFESLTR